MSLADPAAELRIAGTPSLGRAEMDDGALPLLDDYAAAIRRDLEAAGVEFTYGGSGMRLRQPSAERPFELGCGDSEVA